MHIATIEAFTVRSATHSMLGNMDVVKPYDTRVLAQINHAGSHAYNPNPVAPSAVALADGRQARETS